jgi:hypothetical protein
VGKLPAPLIGSTGETAVGSGSSTVVGAPTGGSPAQAGPAAGAATGTVTGAVGVVTGAANGRGSTTTDAPGP